MDPNSVVAPLGGAGNVGTFTATTANFNLMLKECLTYPLLREELEKRSYALQHITKKKADYAGGPIPIAFEASRASSVRAGGLVEKNKINRATYAKGYVKNYKELWGAMEFNYQDLVRSKDPKQTFLVGLKEQVTRFAEDMNVLISRAILGGPYLAKVTGVDDAATGILVVDRLERLQIGQFLQFGDTSALKEGYIGAINVDTNEITVVTSFSDVTANAGDGLDAQNLQNKVNLTGVEVGHTVRIQGGFEKDAMITSIPEQLLAGLTTLGGVKELFGLAPTRYPFLQAFRFNGGSSGDNPYGIKKGHILEPIFDIIAQARQRGRRVNATSVIMSYRNFAWAMKELELGNKLAAGISNGRQFTATDHKMTAFGWDTIKVAAVGGGEVELVAVAEMDDDKILGLDWSSIDLLSNGMVEKVVSPDGNEFYVDRDETAGYKYIVDLRFFGEVVVSKPCNQLIIHSID